MKRLLKRGISDKTIILYTKLLKKISKTLTVIVIVALVSTYVPWDLMKASAVEMVSSENSSSETKVQKVNQSDNKIDPSLIPVSFEDVEKRTATEKHFRKVDGTYEAVIYDHAVNYYEDGKWKEIDNTLKDSEQGFENTSNNFKVHLPNKLDDNKSISVKYGQYQISWNINNSNQSDINVISSLEDNSKDMKNVSKSIQKVTYENIFENVNVEYYIVGDSIKENFILNEFSNDVNVNLKMYKNGEMKLYN